MSYSAGNSPPSHRRAGLHDVGRGVVFSKTDEHQLKKLVTKPHFDTLNDLIDRKCNGQSAFIQHLNKPFEPEAVLFKDDLVVQKGRIHTAKMGVGESALIWGWMAAGTGTDPEDVFDEELQTEIRRIALAAGSRFSAADSMKFGGYFDSSTSSGTITEYGTFNGATPGPSNSDMLCRTVQTPGLPHVVNLTFFLLTQVVTFTTI